MNATGLPVGSGDKRIGTGEEESSAFVAKSFVPRRFLRNGHLQTIIGNFLPRVDQLPPASVELVEVSPASGMQGATELLCKCHWQREEVRAGRPTAILVHGLEGSADSQYVVGNANKLWRAGANVIRMNMRNCGGNDYEMAKRTPTLYHSGLSGDVYAVMKHFMERERLESIALIGYSMGGNLVLKLAGELGVDAPVELHSVVGVSPAIDLGPSAAALHRPANRIYERRFLRALMRRYRRKVSLFPQVYDANRAVGVRSLRDFDDRITALYSGFSSAEDYYFRASAARVVDRIAVPALILHSLDDPFVTITAETRVKLEGNPYVTLVQTEHGGHCAFLTAKEARDRQESSVDRDKQDHDCDDGYWAEGMLLRFVLAHR